jgi:hypothetical protein
MAFALKPLLARLTGGGRFLDRYLIPALVAILIGLFHHLATVYPTPMHDLGAILAMAGVHLTDASLTTYLTALLIAMATLVENHISVPGLFAARPAQPVAVADATVASNP